MKPIISNYDVFADGESVGVLENGDWLQLVSASGSRHHYRLSAMTYLGYRKRRVDSLLGWGLVFLVLGGVCELTARNLAMLSLALGQNLRLGSAFLVLSALVSVIAWWLSERMRLVMQFGETPLLIVGTPKNMWPLIDYMKKNYGLD
jgi:uncharacterized membrane protein YqjE